MSFRGAARTFFRIAAAVEPAAYSRKTPRSLFDPRHLARASLLTARFGAEIVDTLWKGPEAGLAYTELDNKVRAFHLFETVVSSLELKDGRLDAAFAVDSAKHRLGDEYAVWASEGIGYELGARRQRAGGSTKGLLHDLGGVPRGIVAVLHTGVGMALAEASLERLARRGSPEDRKTAVAEHIAQCSEAALPGYASLAFEPLGLMARLLEPGLVGPLATTLADIGGAWREFFWHGVGRGLYFLPANLPPARSAPWKGLAMSREEPPDSVGQKNAASGFGWAVTLVNLSAPSVVESFLACHAPSPSDPTASGVASALSFWQSVTGGSKELRKFVGHVPQESRRELWDQVVRRPFEAAPQNSGRDEPAKLAGLFRCP